MSGPTSVQYVVVGGGTTGAAVARRLVDAGASVAIVEAGYQVIGDERVEVPGYFGKTLGDKTLDWGLETCSQKGLGGRKVPLPRGKALGGTSVINSMTWGRASKNEYDDISRVFGNGHDWSWDDLLPHFKSSETIHPPTSSSWADAHGATYDPKNHGTNGPMHRGFVPWLGETHIPFFKSLNKLDVPTNGDHCSGENLGVFTLSTSIDPRTATRNSSSTAFYAPVAEKIDVIDGAHVLRILLKRALSGECRAMGVEFLREGRVQTIFASREVILSAGAYNTPHILELSGIGDGQRLRKLGISPLIDLPGVGENLQDHLLVPTSFEVKSDIITGDSLLNPEYADKELSLYRSTGLGQYASIHSAFSLLPLEAVVPLGQAKLILAHAELNRSEPMDPLKFGQRMLHDLQKKWYWDSQHGQFEYMHVPQFCALAASEAKSNTPYLSILSLVMHPFSKGVVHTTSLDPLKPPHINPRYLENPADLELLREAIRFACQIARTEPLSTMIVEQTEPSVAVLEDDATLNEYIKMNLETAHHPVGTAAMMPKELGGVVGPDLKVHGCSNLRIADASVIPMQISAHPQATLYAIAEKISWMIIRDRHDAELPEARL